MSHDLPPNTSTVPSLWRAYRACAKRVCRDAKDLFGDPFFFFRRAYGKICRLGFRGSNRASFLAAFNFPIAFHSSGIHFFLVSGEHLAGFLPTSYINSAPVSKKRQLLDHPQVTSRCLSPMDSHHSGSPNPLTHLAFPQKSPWVLFCGKLPARTARPSTPPWLGSVGGVRRQLWRKGLELLRSLPRRGLQPSTAARMFGDDSGLGRGFKGSMGLGGRFEAGFGQRGRG